MPEEREMASATKIESEMANLTKIFFPFLVACLIHLCLMPVQSYVVKEESSYPLEELKVTQLHFFHQDLVSGANPTALTVARPNGTASPLLYGTVAVFDNRLTEGVDPASPLVGNAQGIYAFTGRDNFSMFVTADFGFTTGKYNGSSISITTRNTFLETEREQAVVGGRGQFRLARGFARLTTRLRSGPDAIVEYNVTVLHY